MFAVMQFVAKEVYRFKVCVIASMTAPQDADERLVLQVNLGSNSLEFSVIRS